jgi:hypothetical protein
LASSGADRHPTRKDAGFSRQVPFTQTCQSAGVIRVAPLQYAYELGEATNVQLATLQEWKRYTLKLMDIEEQPDFPLIIDWPASPASVVTV